jgi:hypothetical protein
MRIEEAVAQPASFLRRLSRRAREKRNRGDDETRRARSDVLGRAFVHTVTHACLG